MSQNVTRLKELLFDRESATLAELQARIDGLATSEEVSRQELRGALEALLSREAAERRTLAGQIERIALRAGSEEQFRSSVADVLDGALREAEQKRHAELSRALAPLMVKTIKVELRNSQDEMVEALYPITGRMVKAYIASAMKDLVDQINRRLSGGSNPLMLRLRSIATGKSVAELALAESQRLEVVELFLVRRGSGELVQHWPERASGSPGASNSDIHLSGVLTAINDFAAEALKDDGGTLRAFALDDFQLYLRGSPVYLLAAKCRGAVPAGVEAVIDDEFLALIERTAELRDTAQAPNPVLPSCATRMQERLDERYRAIAAEAGLGFNPLKALAWVIALPLCLLGGWWAYTTYETSQVREAAASIIGQTPALNGYPTQLDVASRGREITLTGLVPTTALKGDLLARMRSRLPASAVIDRLTVLPNQSAELEPQVTRVRRELAVLEGEAIRSALRRASNRAVRRLEHALPHLEQLQQSLTDVPKKSLIASMAKSVAAATSELRQLQTSVLDSALDRARLDGLAVPMARIAEQLSKASTSLATVFAGGAATALTHADGAPADVVESAEELSLSAEQFSTLAVAASQAAGVKPVVVPLPAPLPPPAPTARDRLESFIRAHAIFFGDGNDFRDPAQAQRDLDELAGLIRAANLPLRLVGYTDERGGQLRNSSLSQTRAQRVTDALIERGVPRRLLIAVGRPAGRDISPQIGPQSPNRRVEFEIGFAGEAGDQP